MYQQHFVKENTLNIDQLIKTKIAKLGENIAVSRFVRFKVGDVVEAAPGASGTSGSSPSPASVAPVGAGAGSTSAES